MQDNFDIPNLLRKETSKMKLNKNLIAFLGIGLVILIVLGFLGYQYIAPFGTKVSYQFNQQQNKDKISVLKGAEPSENIDNNATNTLTIPQQTIRRNIASFNLKLLSKKIDGVWVNLRFKGNPTELKIGVKGDLKRKYTYQPLYQQFLESIKPEKFSDLLFWQKEKKYKDFLEFAKNSPLGKITAVYNFDPAEIFSYIPPDATQGNFTLNKLLRGTHSMLVKVDNAPLTIDVKKQDQNMYKGADVLSIEVYKENTLITKKEIPDDGIADATNLMLQPQEAKIEIKDILPGVYRVLLLDKSKGGDVIISSIKINQKGVIFNSPIFIVDNRPASLFTNSLGISVRTAHPQGLQTLKISGGKNLEITKAGIYYPINLSENTNQKQATKSANLNQKLNEIDIPKNDLIIRGGGVFTFDKNSFFNPNPLNSTDLTGLTDTNSLDYVIARYKKVKKDGDWNVAQAYFDPKDINVVGDKLYFSLESPGLSQSGGEIAISSLEVTVDKPGWFGSVNQNSTPTAVAKKGQGFFGGIWSNTTNFFKNLWPFGKNESKISNHKSAIVNHPSPTPTLTLKESLKITVQNGGGTVGIAGKYADLLKTEGFKNVDTANAANSAFKNATISYNKDEEKKLADTLDKIKQILSKEYETIDTNTNADKGKIVIILGQIPKPTPTPIKSGPTASPSAH